MSWNRREGIGAEHQWRGWLSTGAQILHALQTQGKEVMGADFERLVGVMLEACGNFLLVK